VTIATGLVVTPLYPPRLVAGLHGIGYDDVRARVLIVAMERLSASLLTALSASLLFIVLPPDHLAMGAGADVDLRARNEHPVDRQPGLVGARLGRALSDHPVRHPARAGASTAACIGAGSLPE
jgi:hypothetical protein